MRRALGDARWRLVVPVGLGIAILTFLLVRLINFYIWDRWGISKPGPGKWWFTYPGTRYVLPVACVLSKAGAVSRVGGDFAPERAIR